MNNETFLYDGNALSNRALLLELFVGCNSAVELIAGACDHIGSEISLEFIALDRVSAAILSGPGI